MKKSVIISIISISLIAIAVTVGVYKYESPKSVDLRFDWNSSEKDIKSAYKNAELVINGKVNSERVEMLNGIPFTHYNVAIDKNTKGEKLKSVDVRLTGGKANGVTYTAGEQQFLEVGKDYTFMLIKTYPEDLQSNVYTLVGGYQGAFELDNNKKVKAFNKSNKLEKELLSKTLEDSIK